MNLEDTLAGGFGAFACVMVGMPFDVTKLRMQTGWSSQGLFRCLQSVTQQEGVRALWKGASPALASALLENATVFTVNGALKRVVQEDPNHNLLHFFASGGISGFFSCLAMCPAEVIKCRLQRAPDPPATPFHALKEVLLVEGPRGLWRGLPALWTRDIPFNFFFFGFYESYSHLFRRAYHLDSNAPLPFSAVFLSGGFAGMSGWSIVYPADIIKSQMQFRNSSEGYLECVRRIVAAQGWRGMYRGLLPCVIRAMPANGALFAGVELIHSLFRQKQQPYLTLPNAAAT